MVSAVSLIRAHVLVYYVHENKGNDQNIYY